MNRSPLIPSRDPAGPKRPQIDRTALATAVTEQVRRDAQEEPVSLLTTMGAVRMLKPLILDRKDRGWTDAMLVAWMRELGVEISVETLRVYRSRMAKEDADGSMPPGSPASHSPAALPHIRPTIATEVPQAPQSPTRSPVRPPRMAPGQSETETQKPRFNTAVDLDDCV